MKLDSSLEGVVLPAIHRARVLEQLARAAERKGWPADALHSLLDDL